jgi:acetyl esterase/lipase
VSIVLLLVGVLLAVLARAATRSQRGHRPLWIVAMAGSELAGWFLVVAIAIGSGFVALGWSGGPFGSAGVALISIAIAGFAVALFRGFGARSAAEDAIAAFTGVAAPIRYRRLAAVISPVARPARGVRLEPAIGYGPHPRHLLDRIGRRSGGDARPALVYVHGGGWWRGRRETQARPALYHLADSGWEVFAPSYRLSPEATFPDHVCDIKRVVAWIREHAVELGVDPGFIAVAGGSTGGNIAALVALTPGDVALQPGFEQADASVQACFPLYGVHDMLNGSGEPLWPYLATRVMKSTPASDGEAWRRASPVRSATANRPPFFVVHGAMDTLVPAAQSHRLVDVLRASGGPDVGHLEIPWANHGFDFFAGPRGRITAEVMATVLDHIYATGTGS